MTRSQLKLLCLILAWCSVSSAISSPNFGHKGGVEWQPWGKAAFDQAKNENKLILINVGMEGCTACNRMEHLTYRNKNVVRLLNTHFIAIAVDAQARPDIGERYSDWAWPATAFLQPDGTQVFAMAGNRLPRNFIPILDDLIEQHSSGTLTPDPHSPYASAPEPVETDLTKLRDRVRRQIDRAFNQKVGGWSNWGVNAEVSGARLLHLYYRAHLYQNKALQDSALTVSRTFLDTLDPVWGGAYEANIDISAQDVPEQFAKLRAVPEKRISNQANALLAFSEAFALTGDEQYRRSAAEIDRYLDNWMLSPQNTWYANQKDTPPNMPRNWWPQDYWLLQSDQERRKYGVPPVDHAVYTDKNAQLALSYIRAYHAFDNPDYLKKAVQATESLLTSRMQPEGWILQSVANKFMSGDQRVHPHSEIVRPFLRTQARFGQLLLALYQTTASPRWLALAERLGDATLAKLYDTDKGGFWGAALDDTEKLIPPRKPLEDNAIAGRFYYDLHVLSKQEKFKSVSERTIRAVAADKILSREGKATGETALLLEKLTAHYVEFTIVAKDFDSPKARQLYAAAAKINHPRKLVHFEKPGRYPDFGEPVVFICSPDRCSAPIKRVADIAKVADSF